MKAKTSIYSLSLRAVKIRLSFFISALLFLGFSSVAVWVCPFSWEGCNYIYSQHALWGEVHASLSWVCEDGVSGHYSQNEPFLFDIGAEHDCPYNWI